MGRLSRRAFTMPATRSMADADSTDVPPNFMTIMSAQQSFRLHQFCVQDRRARRTAHSVVPERHELPVEDGAWTQTADESRHAAIALDIFARLRTVVFRHVLHGEFRRTGEFAFLRKTPEVFKRVSQIGMCRLAAEFHR